MTEQPSKRPLEMMEQWEKDLSCATECNQCDKELSQQDLRVLSVFDHQPICRECKSKEEAQPEYEDASKAMIAACLEKTGKPYGNPEGYCFHHFCPYKC